MKYVKFLYNTFFLLILFWSMCMFSSCQDKSKTDKKLGTQKNAIIQPYDTANIMLIDSNVLEIKKIEIKPISEVYDEDWGEPFELGDTTYRESQEDSLQRVKNKQIWRDSMEIYKKRMSKEKPLK